MVELEATKLQAADVLPYWKHPLVPDQPVKVGRLEKHARWFVPQDELVSRQHVELTWSEKISKLHVKVLPEVRNPVWYQGQPFPEGTEFYVEPGERFIIGKTAFQLTQTAAEPSPEPFTMGERTCSPGELRALSYVDADQRIDVLSTLPAMIRTTPDEQEFEEQIVQMLLQGVPRAHTAALVWINPAMAKPTTEVQTRRRLSRPNVAPANISRSLVHSAVCANRQTSIHHWNAALEHDSGWNNVSLGVCQWAICAPLDDDVAPGGALYVAGADLEAAAVAGRTPKQLEDSDMKFVGTAAELVSALRTLRDAQKKLAILSRFFSPRLMQAVAQEDMEKVLRPRVTSVTVLCCDLRGSCRIAEEGESDLTTACDRISAALEEMTTRITEHDGVISDFLGDAAMSFWGWPDSRPTDAEQAARAALAISRGFALVASKAGHPLAHFSCGLGLASGPGVAGRLGTMDQSKVGVFGPTINMASRLESLTKEFRVPILADDGTAELLKGKMRLRRLAPIQPYGMNRHLMVHELLPPFGSDVPALSQNQLLTYDAALERFLKGEWVKANALFIKVGKDGPSQFLCRFMAEHNMKPPSDWKGVIVMKGK